MSGRVRIDIDGHVADVRLDRADKYNALDLQMFDALAAAADAIAADRKIRAVVLSGAGEHFCAGIDLDIFADSNFDPVSSLATPCEGSPANRFQRAAYAWRELEVPVIAALCGVTFGGGFQVAMGADLRYAAPDVSMSIMESKWGLVPDMAITTTLRGILSPDRVKELAWTARKIGADEALSLGLVTAVVNNPHAAAMALARDCAGRSPDAIRGIKRLVNAAWQLGDDAALALEATIQARLLGAPNQREAVRANVEKRAPDFRD